MNFAARFGSTVSRVGDAALNAGAFIDHKLDPTVVDEELWSLHGDVEELEEEVAPIVLKKKKAKKKVTGRLTDAKEKKIAKEFEQLLEGIEEDEELVIEGAWISELSERHNVPVDKLKEYLEKLANQEDEDEVDVEDPTPVVE